MPNYKLIPCDGDINKYDYVISSDTELISGDTYSVNSGETLYGCFTIGAETTNPSTETISLKDNMGTCFDCLTANTIYCIFKYCEDGTEYSILASLLSEVLVYNTIYLFDSSEIKDICLKFVGTTTEPSQNELTDPIISATYSTCLDCLPPLSSGTETDICQICVSGGTETATFVNVPHPTWTDAYGRSVIQLNMIELGGQNGLNN